ncbi:MAG TPA: copper resistance protein NlpE N-terminal domain-containing protein [Chitinophagaceae bacterium]
MKRTILLFTLGTVLFACNTKKSILSTEYIQGSSYTGTLPCENCDGIRQSVVLDSNNTFRLTETILGSNPACSEKSGSWSLSDGKVVLYNGNEAVAQYAVAGNSLVYLDEANFDQKKNMKKYNGQGMLARKNFIRSKKINPEYLDGIDIVGFGAEPSWSLDIHHNKAIQFSLPGLDAPVAFSPVPPVLAGDSIIYNIVSAAEKMQVVLSPGLCNDGISENMYDYKVTVQFRGRSYTGCGAVINADGTLTGTWILDLVDGERPKWEKQPYLVVDLETEKFYGNTGCNDFTGTARKRGSKICFSDINFLSQKTCNAYDENKVIDALIKCNGYTIDQGRLEMTENGNHVMSFHRQIGDNE